MIGYLKLNYTSEMERALYHSHGVCYELYCRKHKIREEVENRRQKEYNESKVITANLIGKII